MQRWPYEVVGAAFAVLGLIFVVMGYARLRTIERALDRGEFAPLDPILQFVLLLLGAALGAATVLLITLAR